MCNLKKYSDKSSIVLYFIFRLLLGLMFLLHGIQKLFGVFGSTKTNFLSLFWFAGLIELIVGTFVAIGFLTRWSALIGALEMLVAYLMVHASKSIFPIVNKGELALLYLIGFLVVFIFGARKWSIDAKIGKD